MVGIPSRWEGTLVVVALGSLGVTSCGGRSKDAQQAEVGDDGRNATFVPGAAAALEVTTSLDEPVAGECSFREAIQAANTGVATGGCAAGDPAGTEIELNTDVALVQDQNVTIDGSVRLYTTLSHRPQITGRKSAIVISPTGSLEAHRVRFSGFTTTALFVDSTPSKNGALELNGCEVSDNDGPIANVQSVGIFNNGGYVSLFDCLLQRNVGSITGGGLLNNGGVVEISRSSITENVAGQSGGGIHNASSGSIVIIGSTISGNRQTSGSNGGGGGIFNASGTIDIDFTTIADNTTGVDGGGVKNAEGVINVKRSIIAGNFVSGPLGGTGLDCVGTVSSGGYNLHGGCAGWATTTGDKETQDPKLEPLSEQSGWLTRYSKVRPDSAANDAIPDGPWCPPASPPDQLGQRRPRLSHCEMGAVELY